MHPGPSALRSSPRQRRSNPKKRVCSCQLDRKVSQSAPAAFILGIVGYKKANVQTSGKAHAIVAIVTGGLSGLAHYGLVVYLLTV